MKNIHLQRKQYWVFLVIFSLCALLGFSSILIAEIFMPNNAGGNLGRLAMYRYMGSMSLVWALIATWAGYKLKVSH